MTKEELLKNIGLITADTFTTMVNRSALAGYTLGQIQEAYIEHVKRSPYPIKVSDIVTYWDRKCGNTTEALEQRAALIYEKYFKHPKTGYDHVCADKRIVYAFRVAFGTLAEYGSRTNFVEGIDKKDFIKAYVNARPEDYEQAGNVIEGLYHYSEAIPTVICIGGEAAQKLAQEIYNNRVMFMITNKRPSPALENKKALPPMQAKAQKQKVLTMLADFLNKSNISEVKRV